MGLSTEFFGLALLEPPPVSLVGFRRAIARGNLAFRFPLSSGSAGEGVRG